MVFNYFVNPKYSFTENIVGWYRSMKEKYLVDCGRKFVIYTDNAGAGDALPAEDVQFVYLDPKTTGDIDVNKRAKFKYIADYLGRFRPEFDYFAFIQSNARCRAEVRLGEFGLSPDTLAVFRHCLMRPCGFKRLYGDNRGTAADVSDVDTSEFVYFNAGHFISGRRPLESVCQFINRSSECDERKNAFTKWHDETYFNYYLNTKLLRDQSVEIKIFDGAEYCRFWRLGRNEGKIYLLNKSLRGARWKKLRLKPGKLQLR